MQWRSQVPIVICSGMFAKREGVGCPSRFLTNHDDRRLLAARSGILLAPPVRNIDAAREPDVLMRARVPHEIAKDFGAIRAARQEWVHGNAHDLRVGRAFVVKVVELINQQAVELPRAA